MQSYHCSISVGISLPRNVILKIDAERGDIPRSRYILRILERRYLATEISEEGVYRLQEKIGEEVKGTNTPTNLPKPQSATSHRESLFDCPEGGF
jgi:hypothetical protein